MNLIIDIISIKVAQFHLIFIVINDVYGIYAKSSLNGDLDTFV